MEDYRKYFGCFNKADIVADIVIDPEDTCFHMKVNECDLIMNDLKQLIGIRR